MAAVIVFHHAHGVTSGLRMFADRLVSAGHRVMIPDLFDGETFDDVEDGVAYAESVGFDTIIDRGAAAASAVDGQFATVGFSLGVLPAQHLAQTHSRALAAVLCHAAIALGTFAEAWPERVGLQLHNSERDAWGDIAEARALAAAVPEAELYEYDTAVHLVTDSSLADYDPAITELVVDRSLAFLADR